MTFPIVDGHNDTFLWGLFHGRSFSTRSNKGHMDAPRLKEAGFQAGIFALCPTKHKFLIDAFSRYWLRQVNKPENDLIHVTSMADLELVRARGKIGAIMQFEGAGGIDKEFHLLEKSYEKGLRVLGITWADTNKFGTGARFSDPQRPTGLTSLGRELVTRAQATGITIDVSHLNEPSFWDVIEVAEKPVVATHSNARAVCDHPRNLTDEQIKAIAEKHGTIGINFSIKFLDPDRRPGMPMDVIRKHVDHLVEVGGIDIVALGADYDGTGVPDCVADCTRYPVLLDHLLRNGYSEADVKKIAGENLLLTLAATWR